MNRLSIEAIAAGVIAMTAFFHGYHMATEYQSTKHKAELAAINAASTKALADAQEALRKQEQQASKDMADLDAFHTRKRQDEIISRDRTIADLRAGNLRLRKQFTCPAATAAGAAGQAATGTGVGDGAGQGGLQTAHAEFLVRFADDADQAAVMLSACQAIVRKDRGQP